jgi:tRNA pseudouridine38-40 synthase
MEVVGAGRTDTGVHARKMFAHFDSEYELECPQLVYKLNKLLPRDIAVQQVERVADDMHARFSAKSRTYHYYVHLDKNPFLRSYSWQVYGNPDFELMNRAAAVLMEYTDFTSFSKVNTDTKTNDCTITEAHWDRVADGQWRFTITANRFLRNMVRAIVGTLMEVGRGRMTIEQLRQVIEAKDRCRAGDSVPGNALFLVDVKY